MVVSTNSVQYVQFCVWVFFSMADLGGTCFFLLNDISNSKCLVISTLDFVPC